VHKADGSVVDTPAADAVEMTAEVSREAPLYSDLKEKHVPVRSLSTGDTLEYEVHTSIDKAEAPGQFWGADHFTLPGSLVVLAEVLTLELPADKYVQVWSPNHKPVMTEHDGVRSYSWTVAQLTPAPKADAGGDEKTSKVKTPKDPDEDGDGRKLPSVAWTTFHTWAEVGDWYSGLALGRAQPNDALRARAEEVTKDAKTPEEQVRAIYAFVSQRTRYVGIDFGAGRYQPHAAMEVLANQYGDCKDKDTLLEALLQAKGFKTAPALIGAGITPTPDVPSPATFNHVITTVMLPEGRVWLDSTPEVAPYRYLSAPLRDEQALVVPAEGAAGLEKTPAAPPYAFVARFESVGAVDEQGKLVSKVKASYRTDDEVFVRTLARNVAPAEVDKASQYIVSITGFSGSTSDTQFAETSDLSKPIEISYQYTRHPYGDWDNKRIIPPFPWVDMVLPGTDDTEPDADFELGSPRTLVAVGRIKLPEGYHTDLPDPVHVKTDFATFDETYRFDGKEIVIERTMVVLRKKLAKTEWKRYHAFVKDTRLDNAPWIQLIPPEVKAEVKPEVIVLHGEDGKVAPKGGSTTVAVSPTVIPAQAGAGKGPELAENATTQELFQAFGDRFRARDLDGATAVLDRIKAKNLEQEWLWSDYGSVAMQRGNQEQAKSDFEKELAGHPDNIQARGALASMEIRLGDKAGARKTLEGYVEAHPGSLQLARMLAKMETNEADYEGALKTLQRAAEQNPEDRALQLQVSEALLDLGRRDEAAAAAKSAMDGSDDTLVLNNGAYLLSKAGLGLGEAEAASRKIIAALEEKSAAITTAEANSTAFGQMTLLVSGWDTLGWILFREGKVEEAKPWIEAAWRNGLDVEVGDHLGQLYEAMGKKEDALRAYTLAQASLERNGVTADVTKHCSESIERLKKAGVKGDGKDPKDTLQASRTYKFVGTAGVGGWGTFRVQITVDGVVGSQQMSGEQKLASATQAINGMKFAGLLPPGSKARLLRSGVVSCSASGNSCELVLVPGGGLQTERY
jgi:tetratricopeptide (TPR) repeat protein/transglutaminase-like putative cysteine protease